MKNTNSKSFNDALKAYLAPIIKEKAEDYGETTTPANLYQWALDTAKKEVGHEFKRHGDQEGLRYWLSGLGLSIDFYNFDIVTVCERLHDCVLTPKQQDACIDNWFNFIAAKILQYARKG